MSRTSGGMGGMTPWLAAWAAEMELAIIKREQTKRRSRCIARWESGGGGPGLWGAGRLPAGGQKRFPKGRLKVIAVLKILAAVLLRLREERVLHHVENDFAEIRGRMHAPRLQHGGDHRAILIEAVDPDAFEQFLPADVPRLLALGRLALQFLRVVERVLHEQISVAIVTPILFEDGFKCFVELRYLHIYINGSASEPIRAADAPCATPSLPNRATTGRERRTAPIAVVWSDKAPRQIDRKPGVSQHHCAPRRAWTSRAAMFLSLPGATIIIFTGFAT